MQPRKTTPLRLNARLSSVKRFVTRLICHPTVGIVISTIFRDRIPSRGCVINTQHREIVPAVKASLFWGIYESAEVRFVKQYLRRDLDVIELGSSLGCVTSQILKSIGPERMVCVEANPNLLGILKKNIEENCERTRVNIVQGAIADSEHVGGNVNLFLGKDNTESQTVGDSLSDSVSTPALSLSSLLRSQHIHGDFALMSDIEGAEVNFIHDDAGALERCKQIIIELHDTRWQEEVVTINDLRLRLEHFHDYDLRASHGPVCVFERRMALGS